MITYWIPRDVSFISVTRLFCPTFRSASANFSQSSDLKPKPMKNLGGVVKLKAGASEGPFSSFPRRREPRPAVVKIPAFAGMTEHLTTRPSFALSFWVGQREQIFGNLPFFKHRPIRVWQVQGQSSGHGVRHPLSPHAPACPWYNCRDF